MKKPVTFDIRHVDPGSGARTGVLHTPHGDVETPMTISRQKDSQKLNEIGRSLAKKYPSVRYFYSDFKKNRGIDRGQELSRQHSLYRQDYCGCVYSYNGRHPR